MLEMYGVWEGVGVVLVVGVGVAVRRGVGDCVGVMLGVLVGVGVASTVGVGDCFVVGVGDGESDAREVGVGVRLASVGVGGAAAQSAPDWLSRPRLCWAAMIYALPKR